MSAHSHCTPALSPRAGPLGATANSSGQAQESPSTLSVHLTLMNFPFPFPNCKIEAIFSGALFSSCQKLDSGKIHKLGAAQVPDGFPVLCLLLPSQSKAVYLPR